MEFSSIVKLVYQDGALVFFFSNLCWEAVLTFVAFLPCLDGGGRGENYSAF